MTELKQNLREQLVGLGTGIATQNFLIGDAAFNLGFVALALSQGRTPDPDTMLKATEKLESFMEVAQILKQRVDELERTIDEIED